MSRTRRAVVTVATTSLLVAGGSAALAYGPQSPPPLGAGQSAAPVDPTVDPVLEQAAAVHETLLRLTDDAGALRTDVATALREQDAARRTRERAAAAAAAQAAASSGARQSVTAQTHRPTVHAGTGASSSHPEHENGEGGVDG